MTEKELMALVIEAARWSNFWVYHTHDSRRSQAGFPDLVLVHRDSGRLLFCELKSAKGALTPEQEDWLTYLGRKHETRVWKPEDWTSGRVLAVLRNQPAQVTA